VAEFMGRGYIIRRAEIGSLTYLVQLNHIGMSHFLQNFDFSRDTFHVLLIINLLLL